MRCNLALGKRVVSLLLISTTLDVTGLSVADNAEYLASVNVKRRAVDGVYKPGCGWEGRCCGS